MPDTSFLYLAPASGRQEPSSTGMCLPRPHPRQEVSPQPTPVPGESTPALRLPDGRRNISCRAVKLNMHTLKPNTDPEKIEYVVEMHIGVDEDVPGVPWWVFQTGRAKSCHPSGFLISPLHVSLDLFAGKQVTQPFCSVSTSAT